MIYNVEQKTATSSAEISGVQSLQNKEGNVIEWLQLRV